MITLEQVEIALQFIATSSINLVYKGISLNTDERYVLPDKRYR